MKIFRKIIALVAVLSLVLLSSAVFVGCKEEAAIDDNVDSADEQNSINGQVNKEEDEEMTENPKVIITMEDGKTIKLELFPEIAPITVANFLSLVDEKYYDGLIFHRIIENFMIQGGGYYIDGNTSTLCEAPDKTPIKGEFSSNGVNNTLSHDAGVISMARTSVKDSATGQFFICTNGNNKASLDGNYAAFGRTIDQASLDNVLAIAATATYYMRDIGMSDFPWPAPTIQSIRRM